MLAAASQATGHFILTYLVVKATMIITVRLLSTSVIALLVSPQSLFIRNLVPLPHTIHREIHQTQKDRRCVNGI